MEWRQIIESVSAIASTAGISAVIEGINNHNPLMMWIGCGGLASGLSGLVMLLFTAKRGQTAIRHKMWLYEVLRYVARDSRWASRQPPLGDTWPEAIRDEVLREFSSGSLVAYGRRYMPDKEQAPRNIKPDFWRNASTLNASAVMADNSTKHGLHSDNGEAYTEIYFDKKAVKAVWPRRSLLARLRKRSPPEASGTDLEWAKQDSSHDAQERRMIDRLSARLDRSE